MFGSSILEVAIGLIFVYLLMSLICSALTEIIESFLKNRATDLECGIRELFNQDTGGGLVAHFYNHPLIKGLFQGSYQREGSKKVGFLDYLKRTNLPSYIPARNFAYTVIDLVLHPPAETNIFRDDSTTKEHMNAAVASASVLPVSMDAIRLAIKRNLGDSQVGRALRTLAEQSGNDINTMRENIETWFNNSMDRVSGAYTRRSKWIIFLLGFALTVLLNVNTIKIAERLSADATLRNVIVAQAEAFANNPENQKSNFDANKEQLKGLGLPLGWPSGTAFPPGPFKFWDYALPLIGWILTAVAISLGAPFWFDVMKKFISIRATTKPDEKSQEEGSKSRQRLPSLTLAEFGTTLGGLSPLPDQPTTVSAKTVTQSDVLAIPEPEAGAIPDAEDNESHLDGCDVPAENLTLDEELPPTEGGVA